MEAMPPPPSPLESTRLENLSLDPQGAAFDLAGRPVRLNAQGYASPVASMREFYQHALADYYQRSAELSRQAAAHRPPLLRRMLSWVGRVFDRLMPGPRSGAVPGGPPALPIPAPPNGSESARMGRETSPAPGAAALASPGKDPGQKPGAGIHGPAPLLQVVFADQNGVHVIWHLPSAKAMPNAKDRGPADSKTTPPRLELTYGLDSAMAQRLQDCYGQLAQLGYRIAGLDAVRAAPEKSAGEKAAIKPEVAATSPGSRPVAAEKLAGESPQAAGSSPAPRRSRSKPEAVASPSEPSKPVPEPPNPSFLPGI